MMGAGVLVMVKVTLSLRVFTLVVISKDLTQNGPGLTLWLLPLQSASETLELRLR